MRYLWDGLQLMCGFLYSRHYDKNNGKVRKDERIEIED